MSLPMRYSQGDIVFLFLHIKKTNTFMLSYIQTTLFVRVYLCIVELFFK